MWESSSSWSSWINKLWTHSSFPPSMKFTSCLIRNNKFLYCSSHFVFTNVFILTKAVTLLWAMKCRQWRQYVNPWAFIARHGHKLPLKQHSTGYAQRNAYVIVYSMCIYNLLWGNSKTCTERCVCACAHIHILNLYPEKTHS